MSTTMGAIATCAELTDALPVFEHVMRVLEFSMFVDAGTAKSSGQHGWCRYTRQPFWTGLYLLLRSIDAQPFAQLLVHFPHLVTLVRRPKCYQVGTVVPFVCAP